MVYPPKLIAAVITLFSVIILLTLIFTGVARAHDWYPISCCSEKDCRALDEAKGEFVKEQGKFWVLWDGRRKEKNGSGWSPDGKFHLCETPDKHILCFFAPVGGM